MELNSELISSILNTISPISLEEIILSDFNSPIILVTVSLEIPAKEPIAV